jgi:hypothetical protein
MQKLDVNQNSPRQSLMPMLFSKETQRKEKERRQEKTPTDTNPKPSLNPIAK